MDSKKIMLLLDVVKIGSLKRAAEALNYTQSELIYQINSLEQEIGVPLLVRNHRGVSLTAAGAALEPQFRALVDSAASLRAEIDQYTKQNAGQLQIGVVTSALSGWLPGILSGFKAEHPGLNISIYCGTSELTGWLESKLIDLAIVPKHMAAGYQWRFLHRDTICACVPASSPIAEQKTVTYDELRDYSLLNSGYMETAAYNELYQNLGISAESTVCDVQISSTDGATLFPLVASGLGITFLSDCYLNVCPPTVKMVPLDPPFHREIGIITSPGKSLAPAARSFVSYLLADIEG